MSEKTEIGSRSPSENPMEKKKMIGALDVALLVIVSVLAFNNIPRCFYQMGYAAIPVLIIAAILFFIPYAFMISEYGSALKDDVGGIYNWMERARGIKYAFVGIVMWYIGQLIWMIQTFISIWIHFSAILFGGDTTSKWSFFGLNANESVGLLGILAVILMSIVAAHGLKDVVRISNIGGISVLALNVVLLVCGFIALAVSHGHVAQPITASAFLHSPNPSYQSAGGVIAFLAFAILAYGGTETVASVTDQTKDAGKNFPRGMIGAAVVITIAYCLGIFVVGLFTNWGKMNSQINMGNAAIIVMKNLGYTLAVGFGAGKAAAITVSEWFARIVGLSLFLTYLGGLVETLYCALKAVVQGTPKGLWPEMIDRVDPKTGVLKTGVYFQCAIIVVFIALVSFGGKSVNGFFNMLLTMTTVASTLPYMFVSGAFPAFKKKTDIKRPFVFFKTYRSAVIWSCIVTFTVGFANIFCIVEPALNGDLATTLWSVAGPVIFAVIALVMYRRYRRHRAADAVSSRL